MQLSNSTNGSLGSTMVHTFITELLEGEIVIYAFTYFLTLTYFFKVFFKFLYLPF